MKDIFAGLLIQRIKQLAAGTFAFSIRNSTNWTEIISNIYNFIGLDDGNLNPIFIIKNNNSMISFRKSGQKNYCPQKQNGNSSNNFCLRNRNNYGQNKHLNNFGHNRYSNNSRQI